MDLPKKRVNKPISPKSEPGDKKKSGDTGETREGGVRKPADKKGTSHEEKPRRENNEQLEGRRPRKESKAQRSDRPFYEKLTGNSSSKNAGQASSRREKEEYREKPRFDKKDKRKTGSKSAHPHMPQAPQTEPMRLNRFISLSGVCSRRDADELISSGKIMVNGEVATSMGLRVDPRKDVVMMGGKRLNVRGLVYLLMNKPKNLITTLEDDRGRTTVLELVKKYTLERVFPVGRLDRNTTGLLLFTNDGDLAERLAHPSKKVMKLYHLRLARPLEVRDMERLRAGLELEDGPIKPDRVEYLDGKPPSEIGVELHSGRNRIVRRMMEALGYEILSLDRVALGPLTKKELPRGTCRFLSDKEVGFLKML